MMTSDQKVNLLFAGTDRQTFLQLELALKPHGYSLVHIPDRFKILRELSGGGVSLIFVSEKWEDTDGIEFCAEILSQFPAIPLVILGSKDSKEMVKRAMRIGASDYICPPFMQGEILLSVQDSLTRARVLQDSMGAGSSSSPSNLQPRINELEALTRLGRTITSLLDLDAVLSAVVEAAVTLTGAEEGSLLLLDEDTGELYMRAARNFNEDFVRTFRLPIQDTLAGAVLRSGEPVVLDEKIPQKIKTSYLVHSLVYVPLQLHGHTFGVLGVDNRLKRTPLKQRETSLLLALAEYAVMAISNAGLFTSMKKERNHLESILTNLEDGVIVVDRDRRLVLVNRVARHALNIELATIAGRPYAEVLTQADLLEMLGNEKKNQRGPVEITVTDGRIFSTLVCEIPGDGFAVSMHDITNLKKLDRIKSDFVNIVSHDLRSPLTSILGYVELIERVGAVNEAQRDFIHHVQTNVQNITSLINDLLNLGRIEAGFDARNEPVAVDQIIQFAFENIRHVAAEKQVELELVLSGPLPPVLANPVHIRQMVDNLLDNAIKYTGPGGTVTVQCTVAQDQVVLQFKDTGIGIPALDLPHVFDRFYRASNADDEAIGTGLGLSIVKSVVEAHGGRIWVESLVGKGSIFTVVMPVAWDLS